MIGVSGLFSAHKPVAIIRCFRLAGTSAVELARATIKDCHSSLPQGLKIDEVMLVNMQSGGLRQNPAHQVGQTVRIGSETSSFTTRTVCGSGLKAVALDAQSIVAGDNQVCITGGMENMSAAPYLLEKARQGYRMGDGILVASMIKDGLWCAVPGAIWFWTRKKSTSTAAVRGSLRL
ncbi:beta-ketoacyl synthase N-terminal-like domain-containing protein [Citrobacter sp. MNAZ 1397]|uniref:thiolase family protein n=1 Tax=Citrobacter sp. MNAZ 1397 TaxID=2911205 RepID=UPI0032ECE3BD